MGGCAYETARQQHQQQQQQLTKIEPATTTTTTNNKATRRTKTVQDRRATRATTTVTAGGGAAGGGATKHESSKHKNYNAKDNKIKDKYQQNHKNQQITATTTKTTTTTTISKANGSQKANRKVAQLLIFRPPTTPTTLASLTQQDQEEEEQEEEEQGEHETCGQQAEREKHACKDTKLCKKKKIRAGLGKLTLKNIEPQTIDIINDLQIVKTTATTTTSKRTTTKPLGTTICHNRTEAEKIKTNSLTSCRQQQQQHAGHNTSTTTTTTAAARNMAATLAAACIGGGFGSIHELLLHARAALATQLSIVSGILSETTPLAKQHKRQQQQHKHQQPQPHPHQHQHQHTHRQDTSKPQQQQSNRKQLQQRAMPMPTSSLTPAYQHDDVDDVDDALMTPLPHQLLLEEFDACATSKCNNNNNSKSSAASASAAATLSATLTTTTNLSALTLAPNAIANALTATAAATTSAAYNYFGHNNNSNNNSSNNSNNYYNMLRNSFSFYAASSVILMLCYLTTTTSAATTNSDATPLDKHPIQGIDWSKFDESSSDKEILDLLLEKKRYDKRLLPPVNDEDFCCGLQRPDMAKNQNARRPHNRGTLTVNVNVLLLSLASPDESSLKYEVEFLLNQQWNDPRLQYGNKSHYDFLNALHHHDSIWTPDTYFIMHGDFKDPIIPMHFALRIYRNGTITYAMRRHLILSCQGSLHIFPFDDPKCSFSMESISYEEAQIKYVWKNDEDTLRKSPSLTTLNAYLIKNQTTACDQNSWRGNYSCLRVDLIFTRDRAFYFTTVFIPGIILVTSSFITFWLEWNAVPARSMIGNYSCLQVELTFTRDRAYYFTTVFIPGIILVTSSFITFWLEWNAVPARVMIGVTTMLNFFTTSNGFRSTLPVVSNLTAMNVWDGVCMCFIYASLLEFVCVNYVGRKRPLHNVVYRPGENPVTQRLPAVLSRIGVILASPLEIIEREFHAALSSEKASAGTSALATPMASMAATMPGTPLQHHRHQHLHQHQLQQQQQQQQQQQLHATQARDASDGRMRWEEAHGGIIGAAVQNLRARSIKRKSASIKREAATAQPHTNEPIYAEPDELAINGSSVSTAKQQQQQVSFKEPDVDASTSAAAAASSARCRTMATNTPPLIARGEAGQFESKSATRIEIQAVPETTEPDVKDEKAEEREEEVSLSTSRDIEMTERQLMPLKPPRKKSSRSNSPAALYEGVEGVLIGGPTAGVILTAARLEQRIGLSEIGEKRREAGAPNEIVACTTCGGSNSPCTHSANNGCATETCFVQVRKKEPPHPIRVAKTIDVIARITFPTAYSIFLIFFFVHYKGFS